jgi:hypothetical protein
VVKYAYIFVYNQVSRQNVPPTNLQSPANHPHQSPITRLRQEDAGMVGEPTFLAHQNFFLNHARLPPRCAPARPGAGALPPFKQKHSRFANSQPPTQRTNRDRRIDHGIRPRRPLAPQWRSSLSIVRHDIKEYIASDH